MRLAVLLALAVAAVGGSSGALGSEIALQGDIFSVRIDGSGRRNLTHSRLSESAPAVSPDGRRIAFVTDRSGGQATIDFINVHGTGRRTLVANTDALNESTLAWSPSGRYLAFDEFLDGPCWNCGIWQIVVVDVITGEEVKSVSDARFPGWSRDGRLLLGATPGDPDYFVWTIWSLEFPQRTGGGTWNGCEVEGVAWWRGRVVFTSSCRGGRDAYAGDVAETEASRLTTADEARGSGDDEWLAVTRDNGVFVLSPTGMLHRLTQDTACCLAWSRGSDFLAYLSYGRVIVADRSGRRSIVARRGTFAGHPGWTRDRRVVYAALTSVPD